jgi:hypothetical protein
VGRVDGSLFQGCHDDSGETGGGGVGSRAAPAGAQLDQVLAHLDRQMAHARVAAGMEVRSITAETDNVRQNLTFCLTVEVAGLLVVQVDSPSSRPSPLPSRMDGIGGDSPPPSSPATAVWQHLTARPQQPRAHPGPRVPGERQRRHRRRCERSRAADQATAARSAAGPR